MSTAEACRSAGRAVHPISWIEAGVLEKVFAALAKEADLEWVSVDSTSIRAHAQAATAQRKRGDKRPKVLAVHAAA